MIRKHPSGWFRETQEEISVVLTWTELQKTVNYLLLGFQYSVNLLLAPIREG